MTAQASGQAHGSDFVHSSEEPKEEPRCTHRRTISYDRYVELGGEPVEPKPIGITGSDQVGWFVCLECWCLSHDQLEIELGNWPVSSAHKLGEPVQGAMAL